MSESASEFYIYGGERSMEELIEMDGTLHIEDHWSLTYFAFSEVLFVHLVLF